MDCEKFEPLLLDELYEELDELTSAAVKRHVSGCARCGGILNGLKSTRRAVTLPLVPVPAGLEDRILAAAREAQKVVPIKSRMSRALSVAGNWAMRPQTAMAAVFLLMIGTSAFLIRSKNYAKDAKVSVTVEGAPSPAPTVVAQNESLDDQAAAAAHGPSTSNVVHPPPAAASAVALNDDLSGAQGMDRGLAKSKDGDPAAALGEALGAKDSKEDKSLALAPPPAATWAPSNAGAVAGSPYSQQAAPSFAKRSGPGDGADAFSLGSAAFRARNYAEAARQFDVAAQGGDQNAALWAAEATREGNGCAVALGRFEQVAQKAAGTYTGHEASLKAARCQIAMGQLDPARDRLNKLASVPSHQTSAQAALGELNAVAARKAGSGGATGGAVAAPKRAAPASRPQAPSRAPMEAEQKKQLDRANGY